MPAGSQASFTTHGHMQHQRKAGVVWDGAHLISLSADSSSASRYMTFSTALLKLTGMALNRGFEVPASAAAALLLLPGGRPPCDGQVKMLQVLDLEVVTI